MAGEWQNVALGGFTIKIGSGATPRGGAEAYLDEGPFTLIRSQNVLDFQFKHNGLVYINDIQAEQLDGVTVERDDILINITGDSVARVCLVEPNVLPARVNQHVSIVRADRGHFDQRFLFYVLASPAMKQRLLMIAGSGATRNALTKGDLERLVVPKPPLREQQAIAHLLGSLDDKIELNRRMAATLEEMARALFKSWFVDFDPVCAKAEGRDPGLPAATAAALFPDTFGEDGLPMGWRQEPLRPSLAQLVTRGITPVYADDGLAVLNQKCIRNGQVDFALAKRHDPTSRYVPDAKILQSGDILINSTGTGTLGRVAQVRRLDIKATVDTHVTIVRPKRDGAWSNYLGLQLTAREVEIEQLGHGSTGQTELSRDAVASLNVVVPCDQVLQAFAEVTTPMLSNVDAAISEILTLRTLRDTLLPKLISGELRIKDAAVAGVAA